MKTWKELAQRAIDVQDACNLSGVVHSFSEDIRDVRLLLRSEGKESTDNVNTHPICILYSSKIESLTGSNSLTGFGDAYNWAKDQVKDPIS